MRWRYLTAIGSSLFLACSGGDRSTPATRDDSAPEPARGPVAPEAAPAASAPTGSTRLRISGTVGDLEVDVAGVGECEHAADGSIYERPASLWTARYADADGDPLRSLNLTFWRERSGTEAVTLAVHTDESTHRIATVQGGERYGSARASLEGGEEEGTLVVDGRSDAGATLKLRVRCERFTTMIAEGG